MPDQFVLLLEEAEQTDYVIEWGRCCIAGTGIKTSHYLTTKNKCYIDLTRTQTLNMTMLEAVHLETVTATANVLVKLEIYVYA